MKREEPVSEAATETFERHRSLLFSIAYRMLGSVMEAEDVVQEAFLRWQGASGREIHAPKSYLSTVVTRLSIDRLRSAKVRREEYVGPWLPEPIATGEDSNVADALDETLSMAFLVLLESLTPVERAVFLLREVFDYDYAEIASLVGKSEDNCRQISRRARQSVAARRPPLRELARAGGAPHEQIPRSLHERRYGESACAALGGRDPLVRWRRKDPRRAQPNPRRGQGSPVLLRDTP